MSPWSLERVLELRNREARDRTQSYFAEGVRFTVTAADADEQFRSLIVAPKLLRSPLGQMLARRLRASGVPTLSVSPDEFARLSVAEEPQGIAAVIAQNWRPLPRVSRDDCWIAVSEVRSPGNLGTLLRSAVASGATGLMVPRVGTADPFNPSTVRAAMGALPSLALSRCDDKELAAWKQRNGVTLIATTPHAEVDYRAVDYRRPVVLMIGSERKGLTRSQLALCDAQVRIPMHSGDSLNLAVAGSLMLYEVWNQRNPVRSNVPAPLERTG